MAKAMPKLLLDGGEGEKGMGRQVGVGAGGGVRGVEAAWRASTRIPREGVSGRVRAFGQAWVAG